MQEAEFLALVKENQGIIYKLTSLYANDAEEKKDLYQEILLNAWKGWPSFRGDAKFSTWLYRICLNTLLTKKRKPQILDYKASLEELSPQIQAANTQNENVLSLQKAIRQLAETDRAIVSLHLDGFDNGEIAGIVGISVNHVAVKLHRIKQQLSQLLNKQP
ncbi:MAG: sigma-70 family RNA polymerase sigma factor [Chitinophagaceae bacterium]